VRLSLKWILALILFCGQLVLFFALAFLATYYSFGPPVTAKPRLSLACAATGFLTVVLSSKLSGNSWTKDISQNPLQAAALAGVTFLAVLLHHVSRSYEIAVFASRVTAFLAALAMATWWLMKLRDSNSDGV